MTDADRGSLLRRAVEGALDATVARIEGQAVGAARSMVDELEPYLAAETVPRNIDAVVPHLVEVVVPQVIDGVTEHLVATTIPTIIDEVAPALADETVPVLLERMQPYLEAKLVPALVEGLTPYLVGTAIPEIVDGLTPHLVETTVPRIVDEVMPKLRAEVVPAILDDFVDDPRVRDLIREQSQGLLLDELERFRRFLARGDDLVERMVRRARFARPALVTEAAEVLPPDRARSHAGGVTRLVALLIDGTLVALLATQGLAAVLAVIGAVVDPVPAWAVAGVGIAAALLMPAYLTVSWWLGGRTIGALVGGYRVCRRDGRRPGPAQALVRATVGLALAPLWVLGMLHSTVDEQRRGWLDLLTATRTPYRSHRGAPGGP